MEVFDTSSSRHSAPLSCRVRIPMGAPVGPSRIRRSQRGEPHQGECGLTKNPRSLRPSGLEALGLEPALLNSDWGFSRFDVAMLRKVRGRSSSVIAGNAAQLRGGRRALEGGPGTPMDRPTPSKLINPFQKSI